MNQQGLPVAFLVKETNEESEVQTILYQQLQKVIIKQMMACFMSKSEMLRK